MRLAWRIAGTVLMLVMGIVNVTMFVLHGFVLMLVSVDLCQMQIDSNAH